MIASLSESQRTTILSTLTEDEARAILFDWPHWARDKQLPPPGTWRVWLMLAGRGFGKTRTGAEWIRAGVEAGECGRIGLIAPTAADARDVMVEGESGLLAVCPPWAYPQYEPSKRRVTWPNGAIATLFSADEPERLRGPQHDRLWCDEIRAWRYPEAFDMAMLGLRLGDDPRCAVTTTPRVSPLVKRLLNDPTVEVTRGSTYENRANLAGAFFTQIAGQYEGTRLGRQELYAELLEDVPGALWKRDTIEAGRWHTAPDLIRVVVAIDPAVTAKEESDETGIVIAGMDGDGQGYVLGDESLRASPHVWASAAVKAYAAHHADRIIAEANNGGEMVEYTLRTVDENVPVKLVHASRGKQTRAEPVAALYEQGRVHHVGYFGDLEDQMCQWLPGESSPDRMDALVWALTDLMISGGRVDWDVVEW